MEDWSNTINDLKERRDMVINVCDPKRNTLKEITKQSFSKVTYFIYIKIEDSDPAFSLETNAVMVREEISIT